MRIVNLELPKTSNEYGIFKLENMPNVYYRFDVENDYPKLMTDFFADNQPKDKKCRYLPETSKMYQDIQEELVKAFKKETLK